MKITIDKQTVAIKELTVGEIRGWLNEIASKPEVDVINAALIEGVDFGLFDVMTDLSRDQIETMTPNQLQQVADACREVNKHFFILWARILENATPQKASAT